MTIPSHIHAFAADQDAFIREFTTYITNFKINLKFEGDKVVLNIPGYRPIPWFKPYRRRRRLRKHPGTNFHEEAASAAISYFFDHMKVSNFYDVGAYYQGYFTRLALSYQAYPIDIYAFEMRSDYHAKLTTGIGAMEKDGRRVELLLAGLTDHHAGQTDMWYTRTLMFETEPEKSEYREPWWRRLKFALRGDHERSVLHHARVEITSIDHFSTARNVIPDLIKIDVDGYEAKVLKGGMSIFARHHPVILLELHRQKWLDRFCTTRREVLRPMFEIGYNALLLSSPWDRGCEIVPIGPDSSEIDRDETNLVVLY